MRFAFVLRPDDNTKRVAAVIRQKCESIGWQYDEKTPEIILSIGGDGTLLRGIHSYINQLDSIAFVGIHTGTLGFLTDYTQSEVDAFIHDIQNSAYEIEEFPLLETTFPETNTTIYSLNEVRIESLEKTLSLDVYIDGEFFERTTGSGICLSTQAGSTAVNRALSGAVVDSRLRVLQLCEIMPIAHNSHHSLRNPYIMRDDREVIVKSDLLRYGKVCYDHLNMDMNDVSEIHMKTSNKKVRFARYRTYSYLTRLKNLY